MNRDLVKTLLFAWQLPEFRTGLQHLIDLDEVTELLAALAAPPDDAGAEGPDHEVERRSMALLRSALDTPEIRRAVVLLLADDNVRWQLAEATSVALADRPHLAGSIRGALDDPKVREDIQAMLETASVRELIWEAAEHQFSERRWALVRRVGSLLLRHRSARRLTWSLRRHGVLRELRRP